MKVVLDANVFVSAAIQRGPSHRIVQKWLEGDAFELVLCPMLLGEIEDVLTRRPRLRRWISLDLAERFVDVIRLTAEVVPDPVVASAMTRDADDDYLIMLARDNEVSMIVTGDKDLLQWAEQRPPAITPEAFERLLADASD